METSLYDLIAEEISSIIGRFSFNVEDRKPIPADICAQIVSSLQEMDEFGPWYHQMPKPCRSAIFYYILDGALPRTTLAKCKVAFDRAKERHSGFTESD